MRRRDLLKGAAATGVGVGLAGCSAPSSEIDHTAKDVRAPKIASPGTGWELKNRRRALVQEIPIGPASIEAYEHTLIFEKTPLREEIKEATLGEFDQTIMVFFATVVDFVPSIDQLPFRIGMDRILSHVESAAENRFVTEMRSQGLSNISLEGTGTMDIDTGEEANDRLYSADYNFSDLQVSLPTGDEMTIEGDSLNIDGRLAVWHNGRSALVGGGAWPAENFEGTVTEDITDMISVAVNIDLGLNPDEYSNEIRSLIQSIR